MKQKKSNPAAPLKVDAASLVIRPMRNSDWDSVAQIYLEGIQTGYATFEVTVPSWSEWDHSHMKTCRLIAEIGDQVAGWAALSPVSSRCVYAGVAEVSIYVSPEMRGKKVGSHLLKKLIEESEQHGIWTLNAGVFPQNKASLKLHQKLGFRMVGVKERVGKLHDTWYDNCLLERRSDRIGMD